MCYVVFHIILIHNVEYVSNFKSVFHRVLSFRGPKKENSRPYVGHNSRKIFLLLQLFFIQTLLSVLEFHQICKAFASPSDYTAGREFHPALIVVLSIILNKMGSHTASHQTANAEIIDLKYQLAKDLGNDT